MQPAKAKWASAASHRFARGHGNSFRRHRLGKDHGLDDDQFARIGIVGDVLGRGGKQGADWKRSPARFRTTFSRKHRTKRIYLSPGASMRLVIDTFEFDRNSHPASTQFPSADTTFARPVRRLCRNWRLPCTTAWNTWSGARRWTGSGRFRSTSQFFFNAHNDFFEEIAKYRRGAQDLGPGDEDRFGAKNQRTWLMRFHTQTAGVSLPASNLATTSRAWRCRLWPQCSGTQSLHATPTTKLWPSPPKSGAHRAAYAADHCL